MVRLALIFSFLGCLGLTACKLKAPEQAVLRHDLNQPTTSGEAWHWKVLSEGMYFEVVANFMKHPEAPLLTRKDFLSQDHALVKRIGYWQNKIDASLRQKHPDQFVNVPKPRVMVLTVNDPNAFVSPVPLCIEGVDVVFDDKVSDATGYAALSSHQVTSPTIGDEPLRCAKETLTRQDLEDRLAWHNLHHASCKLSLVDSKGRLTVKAGSGCEKSPELQRFGRAENLVLYATSDWITYHSGLVLDMPEEELVSIVAHELGHYYKSHITSSQESYGQIYQLEAVNAPYKPKDDPRFAAFKSKLKTAQKDLEHIGYAYDSLVQTTPKGIYAPVRGQKFHSALFYPMYITLYGAYDVQCGKGSDPSECQGSCQEALDDFFKEENASLLDTMLAVPLNEESVSKYLAIEQKMSRCFVDISLGAGSSQKLDAYYVKMVIASDPNLQKYLEGLPENGSLEKLFVAANKAISSDYPSYDPAIAATMPAFYHQKDALADKEYEADVLLDQLITEGNARLLGQFTIEQEADDLAVEWLAELSLDPYAALRAQLRMMEFTDAVLSLEPSKFARWRARASARQVGQGAADSTEGDAADSSLDSPAPIISAADCRAMYENAWKGPDGVPVIIPVSDYLDPHHQGCFRAFDIDQEVKAHGLASDGSGRSVLLSSEAWKKLQDSVKIPTRVSSVAPPAAYRKGGYKKFAHKCRLHPK